MTVDDVLRGAARTLVEDVRAGVDAPAALERVVTSRPPRRRLPLVAAAVLLVALVAAAVVVATTTDDGEPVTSGAPTTDAPRPTTPGPATGQWSGVPMTVEPAIGLEDGDVVAVTAEGLDPGLAAGFVLCRADALEADLGMSGCTFGPNQEQRPDAAGRLEGTIVVERLLATGDGETVEDCARDVRCAVGVASLTREPTGQGTEAVRLDLVGLVAIELVPHDALPQPTLEVTPSRDLRHGQTVTVSGRGFEESVGQAELCAAGSDDRCTLLWLTDTPAGDVATDPEGRFEVEVPLWRTFPAGIVPGEQTVVDCAEAGCTLELRDDAGRPAPPVELSFSADEPPPPVPTLEVSPTTGLHPGDPITVTLRGLAPGAGAFVSACSAQADQPEFGVCGRSTTIEEVVADDEGVVVRTVPAVDPAAYGVDCTLPDTCAVTVSPPVSGWYDPMIGAAAPVPVQYSP